MLLGVREQNRQLDNKEEAGGRLKWWVPSGRAAAAASAKKGTYRERLLVRMNDEDGSLPLQSAAWS